MAHQVPQDLRSRLGVAGRLAPRLTTHHSRTGATLANGQPYVIDQQRGQVQGVLGGGGGAGQVPP